MKYGKGLTIVLSSVLIFSSVAIASSNIVDSMDFVGEARALTLDKAVNLAMENSPDIDQVELSLEKAKEEYNKNERSLKKLRSYMKDKKDTAAYTEKVTLPELGNKFSLDSAERNLAATNEKVKSEVEAAYFGLQQAQQLVNINKRNLDIAVDIHGKTRQKLELGLVAKQEVIKSELSLIQAQNQYDESLNNAKLAQMNLNVKLGSDTMDNIKTSGSLTYEKKNLGSIKIAIESGLSKRNEVLAVEFNSKLQQLNLDITSGKYPDITYQYKTQKIATDQALKSAENTSKMIEMEIRSNYMDVEQKEKEIIAGQKQVELAAEGLKLTQLSYDVGMAILSEVQQAQNGLLQAELALSKAILDYNLAVVKYDDSIGVGTTVLSN